MTKVVLGERPIKDITLPETGAVLTVYCSITVWDLNGVDFDDNIGTCVKVLTRVIKEWNIYADDKDENPLAITEENIQKLPVADLTFLMNEVQTFATAQKKS